MACRTSRAAACVENIPRVLPDGLEVVLERKSWRREAVFDWLQRQGQVADAEMYRVFNCGIGMTVQVAAANADRAVAHPARNGRRRRSSSAKCAQALAASSSLEARAASRLRSSSSYRGAAATCARSSNTAALPARPMPCARYFRIKPDAGGLEMARGLGVPGAGAGRRRRRRIAPPTIAPWPLRSTHYSPVADRAGGIHAHPVAAIRRGLCRKNFEHPSLPAAEISGLAHASARSRGA